jgi:TolA-binding protein
VAIVDDTLGYIASYYLGNLYVKQGNKNYALAAYKVCKDHSFDAVLEEESLFQYARVCLDIGNFDEAVKSIQEYKSRYPGSSLERRILMKYSQKPTSIQKTMIWPLATSKA